jgi:NhaP-type Na+/H+ or K+/H+ antiporter
VGENPYEDCTNDELLTILPRLKRRKEWDPVWASTAATVFLFLTLVALVNELLQASAVLAVVFFGAYGYALWNPYSERYLNAHAAAYSRTLDDPGFKPPL